MKLFLESVDLEYDLNEFSMLNFFDGIAVNRTETNKVVTSLLSKVKDDLQHNHNMTHYTQQFDDLDAEVLMPLQAMGRDINNVLAEAEMLAELSSNIVIRVPFSKLGIKLIRMLAEKDIKTNCTQVSSIPQALLSVKAGAKYIATSVKRFEQTRLDANDFIRDLSDIFDNYDISATLLIEELSNLNQISHCARCGVGAISINRKVFEHIFSA